MTEGQSLRQVGVGAGIPLGAGIGVTTALLAGADLAAGAGYGAGAGIIVGAVAGRFAERSSGDERWVLRAVAATLLVGLVVGAAVGAVAAWGFDARPLAGFGIGAGAGGAFGLLLAGVLVATARRGRWEGSNPHGESRSPDL